jgi:hypothetical protein
MSKARLLEGHPAEDLVRICFSKLRFYPVTLKDQLRQEGLWEDLSQELYRIALEGWRQGMTPQQTASMATGELRAFLNAYGYCRYQHNGDGFAKREMPLPDGWERLPRVEPPCDDGEAVEKAILDLLKKHPEGLSQTKVNIAFSHVVPAAVISDHCARLVTRGVIKQVARQKGRGRPPSPMLYLSVETPSLAEGEPLL